MLDANSGTQVLELPGGWAQFSPTDATRLLAISWTGSNWRLSVHERLPATDVAIGPRIIGSGTTAWLSDGTTLVFHDRTSIQVWQPGAKTAQYGIASRGQHVLEIQPLPVLDQ